MSYEKPEENEWVQPVREGYRMACCDCGLVHELDFRIKSGRVQFRARRNNRATAAMRRGFESIKVIKASKSEAAEAKAKADMESLRRSMIEAQNEIKEKLGFVWA